LEIATYYQSLGMDLIDVLEKEIFVEYGNWHGFTKPITIEGLDWQKTANTWMDRTLHPDLNLIPNRPILESKWIKEADSVEWNLGEGSWIKFRKSGTEPKFKIYYNLYGAAHTDLYSEKKQIDKLIMDKYLK
jgi:phosphomannomutase